MKYVGLLVVILIIGLGGYMLFGSDGDEPSALEQGVDAIEEAEALKEQIENRNKDLTEELEGVRNYIVSEDSSVSYTVQKEFFSKPTEPVTGTTQDVSGKISLNTEANTLSVQASANPQTLLSGAEGRDDYVHDQFTGEINIAVNDYVLEGDLGTLNVAVPVQLTMNGITKTVDFAVEGSVSDESINARGDATINMNEFGIEIPSIVNVYTVNEIATISFELVAK